jgi:hypothetical protein
MALRSMRWFALQSALIAFATMAGLAASCLPAAAQFWDDRYPNSRYYQPAPSRDFFSFPFDNGGGFIRPPPVVDSSKAPPPRKLETPPTSTVVVIGDSLADWLAYGLDETYSDQRDIGVVRKIRPTSGLVRYDPKNDTLDWSQAVKDALATEKPNAIIVMLGLNDRVPLRDRTPPHPSPQRNGEPPAQSAGQAPQNPPPPQQPAASDSEAAPQDSAAGSDTRRAAPGGSYDFHTDQWAAFYSKRIDEMIAALKLKGAPVLWVGLPAIRGAKSTGDVSYLDELYRERAEKAGIGYVDIWDGFVDDQGRYAVQGPDFEGQIRRLRTGDGVHFTKAGAVKLASYVDRELRRVMQNRVLPVALPGPEATLPKPGAAGPRPDAGPVLPLTTGGGEAGDLLGAGGRPAQMTFDPVAAKVLSRGDSVAAPAGRADDFSWPRSDASAAPDMAPEPAALIPAAPKKGSASNNDGKKPADAKSDSKNKTASDPAAARAHRAPSADLDGAPRPPAPVGSAATSTR